MLWWLSIELPWLTFCPSGKFKTIIQKLPCEANSNIQFAIRTFQQTFILLTHRDKDMDHTLCHTSCHHTILWSSHGKKLCFLPWQQKKNRIQRHGGREVELTWQYILSFHGKHTTLQKNAMWLKPKYWKNAMMLYETILTICHGNKCHGKKCNFMPWQITSSHSYLNFAM